MNQGGNYWTLFTPGIWKVLHAVLHDRLGCVAAGFQHGKAHAVLSARRIGSDIQPVHDHGAMARGGQHERHAVMLLYHAMRPSRGQT